MNEEEFVMGLLALFQLLMPCAICAMGIPIALITLIAGYFVGKNL